MVGLREGSQARLGMREVESPVCEAWPSHRRRTPEDLSVTDDRVAIHLRVAFAKYGSASARTKPAYRISKRLVDILLASIGLAISAPVIAVCALLVRLDSSGPIIFRQRRVGENGRLFTIIKLRTMHAAALSRSSVGTSDSSSERITRVGGHLRRWSLDELPQFVNVLRGDMSLVGPRPELPDVVLSHYQPWQFERFQVPQGMTGWWQVTERGRIRLCDDTANDLVYLRRASFWFDARILIMTIPAAARQARMSR